MFTALVSAPLLVPSLETRVTVAQPWNGLQDPEVDSKQLAALTSSDKNDLYFWNSRAKRLEPFYAEFGDGSLDTELQPAHVHLDQTHNVSELTYLVEPGWMIGEAASLQVALKSTALPGVPKGTMPAVSIRFQPSGETLAAPVIADGSTNIIRFELDNSIEKLHQRGHVDYIEVLMPSPNFRNELTSVRLTGWRGASKH
jgi:hypothetical protein